MGKIMSFSSSRWKWRNLFSSMPKWPKMISTKFATSFSNLWTWTSSKNVLLIKTLSAWLLPNKSNSRYLIFLLQFWKTIKYTPPVYGADLHKSLMSPSAGSWNLADLDSLLKDAAPVLIKGVTYPYCYVGTWKSIFCWHKEDLDLSAINYLH